MNEIPNRPSSPEGNAAPSEQYLPQLKPETSPENKEQQVEQEPGQASGQERAKAPPSTQPPAPAPAADDTASAPPASNDDGQSDDNMPVFANDVDVIEKEWVNKAKQIIKETHDNPYEQEKAVEQLQIDYLKKRYGHDVKASK